MVEEVVKFSGELRRSYPAERTIHLFDRQIGEDRSTVET